MYFDSLGLDCLEGETFDTSSYDNSSVSDYRSVDAPDANSDTLSENNAPILSEVKPTRTPRKLRVFAATVDFLHNWLSGKRLSVAEYPQDPFELQLLMTIARRKFGLKGESSTQNPTAEELSALLHVQTHLRMVTHRETQATLKVVAADSETVSGKKAIGVFVDELHEFGKQAKADNMLMEATGGLASRPEGFVIYATTQSAEPPAGVFRQKLQFARRVRDGEVNAPTFLPVLYEFPEWMLREKKHRDFENAYITNPNWGLSVDAEFIREKHRESLDAGEEAFRLFLAKHLNVEIGLALRADRWRGADWWEKAGEAGLTLEELIERSEVLAVGIDGGGLDDLLGLAVLGREAQTGRWLHWARAWAHRSVLELRKSEAPLLKDLQRDGELVLVDEVGQDVDQVADLVEQCDASGLLSQVGCDPAAIGAIVDAIVGRGIDQERLIGISQGWRLVGAIKTCERKLAEGKFAHGGTKLMAWCVGNARIEPRGNAVLITKQASGTGKIDPLMATLNATELMARNPQAQRSFWETTA